MYWGPDQRHDEGRLRRNCQGKRSPAVARVTEHGGAGTYQANLLNMPTTPPIRWFSGLLADRAGVESITASSAIEGVVVADVGRARRIINRRASTLRNRSEQDLAGYRETQDYLFHQGWRPLNAGLILHRLLFAHTAMPGSAFKAEDNLVVDRSPDSSTTVVSGADCPYDR